MNMIIISILTVVCSFGLIGVSAASAEEIAPQDGEIMKRPGMHKMINRGKIQNRINELSAEEREEMKAKHLENMSSILGISADELAAKIEEGKKPHEIAEELGIPKEDMQAKMQEQAQVRMQERLGQLIEEGKITQEQADKRLEQMKKKAENFDPEKMQAQRQERLQKGAEILGITPEELKAQLEEGKKLHEIAEEKGIDLKEFRPEKPPINEKPQGPMNRIHGFFKGLMKKVPWFNK